MDELVEEKRSPAVGVSLGAVEPRRLLAFLAKFLLWFILFMLPIDQIGRSYARAFGNVGNALLPLIVAGERFTVHFAAPSRATTAVSATPWEAVLHAEDTKTRRKILVPMETKSLAYIPMCVFLALALATPIAQRRRELTILIVGFVLLLPMLGLLLLLPLLLLLGGATEVQVFQFGPWGLGALQLGHRALVSPPGMAYVLPGLLWWALVVATRPRANPTRPNRS